MSAPLILTKLRVPRTRPTLVARPRLMERLNIGLARPLTVISAPAGFGKTTLLSAWYGTPSPEGKRRLAWVSLDAGDNDPIRFWSSVMMALQTVDARIGAKALALVQSPQPLPIESVLSVLLNEIDAFHDPLCLVLDDFHVIQSPDIQRGLDYILDHLPPHMHLIVSSRAEPALPLARLRARDQLTEVRAADLRFTLDEASAFLNQGMGLHLTPEQIASLEARTEGWIAGLQLAALSLHNREDIEGFIASFAGSNRFILDYLTEEVLRCQPAPVQEFLLQTCILKRLSAPLCAAVVEQHTNIQELLEQLEKANLFIIPLDDERRWYRYHHLFAELLRARLHELQPERVPELHRRAAGWYEQNGFVEDAVEHALAAKDYERAARLLEQIVQGLILRGEFKTVQNWLDLMPDDVLRRHPWLGIGGAWALVLTNHLDEAEQRVRDLEREIVTLAPNRIHDWKMEMAVLQAAISSGRRDTSRTIALARAALEQLPEDHVYRSVLGLYLGYAYQDRGEGKLSQQAFADAAELSQAAKSLLVAMIALGNLGQLQLAQGHLRRANEYFQQALELAARYGADSLPITGPSLVGVGALLCERNDLESAERTIREGIERGAQLGGVVVDVFSDFTQAQLKRAQRDIDGALQVIEQAEARLKSLSLTNRMRGLAAYRAQLWLVQKNPAAAAWAAEREREPHGDDVRWPWRLIEDLTLARVLIEQGRGDPKNRPPIHAFELLEALRQAIEVEGRLGNVVEVLMLQAQARQVQGDDASALQLLGRALILAEPEGFVRLFVNEGEPLAALLRKMKVKSEKMRVYRARLLAAFRADNLLTLAAAPTSSVGAGQTPPPSSVLDDPLSARELQVLGLMDTGLSNRDIADKFVVSMNTIKTQVKSIYSKLGVRSREEALAVARALHLI